MNVAEYIGSLRARRLSEKTLALYQFEIQMLENIGLDRRAIEKHLLRCKQATHVRKLAIWKPYLRAIGSNLLEDLRAPKAKQRRHTFLHTEEALSVLTKSECYPTDVQLFIRLGMHLGLRISEIMQISKSSLDAGWIRIIRKGGHEQNVPLTADLVERLKNFEGFKRSTSYYRRRLREICRSLGIKKTISPHKLRHTFATLAVQKGANIVALKEMLGHASIATTDRYCHVTPKALEELINGKQS